MSINQQPQQRIELITRRQIIAMTGISKSKLTAICVVKRLGFPQPARVLSHRQLAYNKAEILNWLENNDIHKITLTQEEYWVTPKDSGKAESTRQLCRAFLTGKSTPDKPANATRSETKTVHLQERNDYVPPSRHTQWPSYGGFDYRMSLEGGL